MLPHNRHDWMRTHLPEPYSYYPEQNISKHDNKSCGTLTISLDLDEPDIVFFEKLKNLWKMLKKSPPVTNLLYQHFQECQNSYEQVLRLIYNCQEFHSAKSKTLPFFIMEEFKHWCDKHEKQASHFLSDELKVNAFKIINRQNSLSLTKLVVETFQMAQSSPLFMDLIKCMVEKKQYKEACQSSILLSLQNKFSLDEFLIPLILQDKLLTVDEFLVSSPMHRVELVTFLDNILGKPSVRDAMSTYLQKAEIPCINWEKLQIKPWKKLITRLMKMFNLPGDLTPNLNRKRNEGAMGFLLHKRYIEGGFGDESWREMIQEAIGDDEQLQKELVTQLNVYGDVSEALRWAHFYNVEKKDWPANVRQLDENRLPDIVHLNNGESWDDDIPSNETEKYYKFPLDHCSIHLVDSLESFENFLDNGLQDIDVVGIDCEWKPSFGSQMNELALMQIATRREVFILDTISISCKLSHLWQELGKFLFNNCDILKLGFGFTSDISMIKQSIPELNFNQKQVGFLDLLSLWKQLDVHPKVVLPYEGKAGGPSLSTLVQQCLGYPLDKSEQFSNWEKRPLRHSQLVYAAADAHCLIESYDVMKHYCEKVQFPFEEVCYNLMTNEKFPKKKTKKSNKHRDLKIKMERQDNVAQPESHIKDVVPAEAIKCVCDTMLQGLGKNLRSCGIDTVILDNTQDHMACVQSAIDERRFILTRGNIFNKLVGCVPHGHCLKIIDDDVDKQLKEVVDFYKISIKNYNVFGRCQFCNGNNFVKVSRSTMKVLVSTLDKPKFLPPPPCFMDEASGFSSEEEFFDDEPLPPIQSAQRKWNLYPDEKIDVGLCQTRLGASIQIRIVPKEILDKMDMFYVCEECGKVYWDGSHFGKVISGRLQGIVQ